MSEREHLISDDYRALQAELHKNPDYGSASVLFAPIVSKICEQYGVQEILDYGAGKGRLAQHLRTKRPIRMTMYDPVMPQWSARPEPAEMVACVDVLEHIEPEKLENVLDDLRRCVKRVGFFSVSTVAAEKILSDGRNAISLSSRRHGGCRRSKADGICSSFSVLRAASSLSLRRSRRAHRIRPRESSVLHQVPGSVGRCRTG